MAHLNRRHMIGSGLAGLAGAAALSKLAHGAGPLTPPPGLVRSSSTKTLDTVEPRIPINAETCPGDQTCTYLIPGPGSYYLPGPLVGAAGKAVVKAIAVSSPCSIDGRGFSITGAGGGTPGGASTAGIAIGPGLLGVDIVDLFIRDCATGISAAGSCVTVSDVQCDNCPTGVEVGVGSEVSDALCQNCAVAGFSCPDDPLAGTRGASFSECDAFSCGHGFSCASNCCCCECRACTCTTGYYLTNGCECECCDAISCSTGYSCGSGACCPSCRAITCSLGWSCAADATLDGCECLECDTGIVCGDRAWITNTCAIRSSNVSSTGVPGAGITVGNDSDCDDCCVDNPTGHGFVTGSSCSLTCCCTCRCAPGFYGASCADGCDVCECTFTDNWGGISCGSTCSVLDNVCIVVAAGAGGGPHVKCASHCRVEDNSLDNCPIGVQVIPGSSGTMVCSNSFHRCSIPIEAIAASNAIAPLGQVANGGAWTGVSPLSNLVH